MSSRQISYSLVIDEEDNIKWIQSLFEEAPPLVLVCRERMTRILLLLFLPVAVEEARKQEEASVT